MLGSATQFVSVNTRWRKKLLLFHLLIIVAGIFGVTTTSYSASPGLPFTEDFSDTTLRDAAKTTANWSTEEQALILAWRKTRYGVFGSPSSGVDISTDEHITAAIALGDVDGDGDVDLVAGNYSSVQYDRLYLNNGDGTFDNGRDVGVATLTTAAVALGDVDQDGDLDMILGHAYSLSRLYLNNGDGTFASGSDIPGNIIFTYALSLGDMDGDGDLDLVEVGGNASPQFYSNNGDGSFLPGVAIGTISWWKTSVVLGDIDGDEDTDIIVGVNDQVNLKYLNNGDGTFSDGTAIGSATNNTHAVRLGDLDSDGDLDLVTGNRLQPDQIYLNTGSGNFVEGGNISDDSIDTLALALGDIDSDGDLDLVAGYFNHADQLFLNNSDGTFAVASDITTQSELTRAVELSDIDGDGDLDFITGMWGPPNRTYINNSTPNPFTGSSGSDITTDAHWTAAVALGDVDRDGDVDLVAGNRGQPNRLYLNYGNGTFAPGTNITEDIHYTNSVTLGDVDNDGDLDLVVGNGDFDDWEPNRLYLNEGEGNFVAGPYITFEAHNTFVTVLGDMDGDGDLDVISGNYGYYNRLYFNNGNGTFSPGISISLSAKTTSLALGDVDGDNDLDIVEGNADGQINRLYLNNGDGSFAAPSNIASDYHSTYAVSLGDLDTDGDLDLVVANYNNTNRAYLNDGDGNYTAGYDISGDVYFSFSASLGDVDSDGDLDVVIGNGNHIDQLFLNNGDGIFTAGMDITTQSEYTRAVALGDTDGDGDLDYIAGVRDLPNRLYSNNGISSPFVGISGSDITMDTNSTYALALGDMDGDGDIDLVVGSNGVANRIYLNNGSANPFAGVTGSNITNDAHYTRSVAIGDVDGDGHLDVVVGNVNNQINRLYLNNGGPDPFSEVIGSDITTDAHDTYSIALGDIDGDGDLDVVAGNAELSGIGHTNRLYLNNGITNSHVEFSGSDITTDIQNTVSVALGDVDSDGDLDVVAGNWDQINRLYLNSGEEDPFDEVIGIDITTDAQHTVSIALGDMDGDGDLDLVAGNWNQIHRLYLNSGEENPFEEVIGIDITTDAQYTNSIALGDVDGDGDLDLVAGNDAQANRLYINNGSADPFAGTIGSDITSDENWTAAIVLGDVDGNGDIDVVAGNYYLDTNRLYRRLIYNTAQGLATSLEVDTEIDNISGALLGVTQSLPINTSVGYYLSNNGGIQWFQVIPGKGFVFPTTGSDLRWRAELHSLSPILTPRVEELQLDLDSDGDSFVDSSDNCTLVANPDQRDTDEDGYGNYCDPDFNNDGWINAVDLAYMKVNYFSTDPDADLNGDGFVNAGDLAIIKVMYFGQPGPSGLVP